MAVVSASRSPSPLWLRAAAALTYPLAPADYLSVLRAGTRPTMRRGRVEAIGHPTPDSATLTIRPGRRFPTHRAGQFVRVGVDIDGVRYWRCYSISSMPERDDGRFTITVKAIAGGRVSEYLVRRLREGDVLQLAAPDGEFVLPQPLPPKLLFVTAGSGITPVMSMLASMDACDVMPEVTVIHVAPDPQRMIFGEALAQLADRHPQLVLHRLYTQVDGGERFTPARLPNLCADWQQRQTWTCGPDDLLQALERHWRQAGIGERLHVERFNPPVASGANAARASEQAGSVQFTRSTRTVTGHSGQSLLELAEDNGLAPAHGCRMGICHECTATLRSGRVRDLRDGRIHEEEGDCVQICVCAPLGDVTVDI